MAVPLLVLLAVRRAPAPRRAPFYAAAPARSSRSTALGAAGLLLGRRAAGTPPAVALPAYFCLVNLASLQAVATSRAAAPVNRWRAGARGRVSAPRPRARPGPCRDRRAGRTTVRDRRGRCRRRRASSARRARHRLADADGARARCRSPRRSPWPAGAALVFAFAFYLNLPVVLVHQAGAAVAAVGLRAAAAAPVLRLPRRRPPARRAHARARAHGGLPLVAGAVGSSARRRRPAAAASAVSTFLTRGLLLVRAGHERGPHAATLRAVIWALWSPGPHGPDLLLAGG